MKFLDQVKIFVKSGHGGAGSISFRREKYIEFGGPNGGNGGAGGNVYAEAVDGLNTLIDFRYSQHFKAPRGGGGMGRDRHGKDGKDLILRAPIGTQIFCSETDRLLVDFTEIGETVLLAKGGDGGRGNTCFKTSTNQAPRKSEPGWPGEEKWFWLRLKLIADVGLLGLPNAGKSTFLSKVSRARPKVADYPFTTLHPNLGVVYVDNKEFVIADIPGLIEGAHSGQGLGTRFLGHVERCGVLLHLIDGSDDAVVESYKTIRQELELYGGGLAEKPEIIVINKIDALIPEIVEEMKAELSAVTNAKIMTMSGVTGENTADVLRELYKYIAVYREDEKRAEMLAKEEVIAPPEKWTP